MQTPSQVQVRCSLGWPKLDLKALAPAFKTAWRRLAMLPALQGEGSGVVIAGGGRYERWALAVCRRIRMVSTGIPVEVWHLNREEITLRHRFRELQVDLQCATDYLHKFPMRRLHGWHLKMMAVLQSKLQNVLFLDADCFPTPDGLRLLHHPTFLQLGAIFFPDVRRCHGSDEGYAAATLLPPRLMNPPRQEFETGQFLVDKARWGTALRWACWASEHSDTLWRPGWGHGDKLTTELGVRMDGRGYGWGESSWEGWGIRHTFGGVECFQHAIGAKRREAQMPEELRTLL